MMSLGDPYSEAMPIPSTDRSRKTQAGYVAVELGLMLPVFVLLSLGTLQLAQVFLVQRQLLGAAITGARAGAAMGSTTSEVDSAISTFLSATTIGTAYTSSASGVGSGSTPSTDVTVTVDHNLPVLFRLPMIPGFNGSTVPLTGSATFRHE